MLADLICSWGSLGSSEDGDAQLFQRPPDGGPCAFTLPVIQGYSTLGVLVVSNARLCELYSQAPGEAAASYVCTLRGNPEPSVAAGGAQFLLTYQSKGPLRPGSRLTLRLLSLTPSKDQLRLHSVDWIQGEQADSGRPQGQAVEGSRQADQEGNWGEDPGNTGSSSQEAGAGEGATGKQGRLEGQGGGSQMDEVRSLLQSAALGGVGAGPQDPKRALMAALARSALSSTAGSSSGSSDSQAPAQLAGLGGGAAGGGGDMMARAMAALLHSRQLPGLAGAQAGPAGLPGEWPALGQPAAAAAKGGGQSSAGAPDTPQPPAVLSDWLGRQLAQLEVRLAGRLEAGLGQLEARLRQSLLSGAAPSSGPSSACAQEPPTAAAAAAGGSGAAGDGASLQAVLGPAGIAGAAAAPAAPEVVHPGLEQRLSRIEERLGGLERLGEELKGFLQQALAAR